MSGLGNIQNKVFILAQVGIIDFSNKREPGMLIATLIGFGNLKSQQSYNTLSGFVTIMPSLQMPVGIIATWQLPPTAPVAHHLWKTSFIVYVNALILKSYGFVWE
jgi:hypothetical protein